VDGNDGISSRDFGWSVLDCGASTFEMDGGGGRPPVCEGFVAEGSDPGTDVIPWSVCGGCPDVGC